MDRARLSDRYGAGEGEEEGIYPRCLPRSEGMEGMHAWRYIFIQNEYACMGARGVYASFIHTDRHIHIYTRMHAYI